MNEDFVSFSLAKKLKEKGYTLDTAHHYDDNGGIVVSLVEFDDRCVYPCPEIHQVLKWLREEKKVEIVASYDYGGKTWGYQVGDMELTEDSILSYRWNFPTYEEAALAGIEYCLDNLI